MFTHINDKSRPRGSKFGRWFEGNVGTLYIYKRDVGYYVTDLFPDLDAF